ncbi:MAG: pyruvate carboxyltransferase [Dehalococcoidia bacterium]|nr:pyruvate carboxyltransferase [Dehalococcoidia bacterium]
MSQEDFEAVLEISKRVKADVVVFCRGMRSDVDLAVDAGAWGVIVELPSNQTLIEKGYGWTREDVIKKGVDTCNYAKKKGLHTTFFLIDSSGADPDFLKSIVQAVVAETDIDSLTGVDTFGRLHPMGTERFVERLREWSGVPVEIHVHNDFGLGVANCLAAVKAGAEVVHTNMLGLGERSGGVPPEEMAVALEFLFGVDTGLNLEKLKGVAGIFQEVSGITVPGHKPVVGKNAFAYEVGIASMFSYRLFKEGHPLGVMPYHPHLVGNEFWIAIGKQSGKYSVLWHLDKMGLSATESVVREIVERVKEMSIRERRMLSLDEFKRIYEEAQSEAS